MSNYRRGKTACDARLRDHPGEAVAIRQDKTNRASQGFLTALATAQVVTGAVVAIAILSAFVFMQTGGSALWLQWFVGFVVLAVGAALQHSSAPDLDRLSKLPLAFRSEEMIDFDRGTVNRCASVWPQIDRREMQQLRVDLPSSWVRAGAVWIAVCGLIALTVTA